MLAANVAFGRPLIQSLMFSVALAVGLTPELLPMITTVTLSRGAVRMSRKKVIVKRLAAIHDLGAMTVLCTDKTGTLTSAEIELAGSLGARRGVDRPAGAARGDLRQPRRRQGLARRRAGQGQPDAAKGWTRRGLLPFDYQRRMGAVLAEGPEGLVLIVKGAPEAVLAACRVPAARPFTLTRAAGRRWTGFRRLAAQGLRAVAVASRPWSGRDARSHGRRRGGPGPRGPVHLRRPAQGQRAGGGRAASGRRRAGGDPLRRRSAGGRAPGRLVGLRAQR